MNIDWQQLITKAMKDAVLQESLLVEQKELVTQKNKRAIDQITLIQDRIDTIEYGVEIGEADDDDVLEQQELVTKLKLWKAYKFALSKDPSTTEPEM